MVDILVVSLPCGSLFQMNLEIRNFTDGPIIRLVGVDGEKVSGITYTAEKINNEVVAHNISKQMQYYWALPQRFLGNKVKIL